MNIETLIEVCKKYGLTAQASELNKIKKSNLFDDKNIEKIKLIKKKVILHMNIDNCSWFGEFSEKQKLTLLSQLISDINNRNINDADCFRFCNLHNNDDYVKFHSDKGCCSYNESKGKLPTANGIYLIYAVSYNFNHRKK